MLYYFLSYMLLGIGAGGFLYGKIGGMPPCALCNIEQYLLIIAGVAALLKRVCVARFTLLVTGLMALYHTSLQMNWVNTAPRWCQATFSENTDGLEIETRSSCGDKKAQLFGLPMPAYVAIVSFISMALFGRSKHCSGVSCELENRRKNNK